MEKIKECVHDRILNGENKGMFTDFNTKRSYFRKTTELLFKTNFGEKIKT